MSFISVEPQSRVFLESHSKSLLTKFDRQLAIIANRYLAFFQERSVIDIWVLCIPLSLRLSGEELKHHSQFSPEQSIVPSVRADFFLSKYRFVAKTPSKGKRC
jgi:hypothetical protein